MSVETFPTSILDYTLDPERVAREPMSPRDAARMMVVFRGSDRVEHRLVRDLPEYLRTGDLLVVNRTHVMAARLKMRRASDGRAFEGLLESPISDRHWKAFIREAKRLRPGDRLMLVAPEATSDGPVLAVIGRAGEGVEVVFEGTASVESTIARFGWTPLPPYIRKARERSHFSDDAAVDRIDRDRYQTVYARSDAHESIAAPTAGLHFTPELLSAIQAMGVHRAELSLQVGAGTFKPVEASILSDHPMHREHFEVSAETLEALRQIERERDGGRGRIVAVGTTSVRALESLPDPLPEIGPWISDTALMILPNTPIRRVDVLMTNFHLPRSTLLSLVAAFVGVERLHRLYALAQREGYRFFSFGDAMLIL